MNRIRHYRTFYMGLSAIWILVFHYFPYPENGSFLCNFRSFIHATGFTGADIFLFLSGFGLIHSLTKKPVTSAKDYLSYVLRRLLRIYPAYFVVTILNGLYYHWDMAEYVSHLTFVQQFLKDPMNYLWFVPCVLVFSLLLPIYYFFFQKVKHKSLFTVLLSASWILLLHLTPDFGFQNMTYRVPIFLIGVLCGYCAVHKIPMKTQDYVVLGAALITGLLLQYGIYFWGFSGSNMLNNILIVPGLLFFSSVFLDSLKKVPVILQRYLLRPIYAVFCWMGMLSLEIYLTQYLAYDPGFDRVKSFLPFSDKLCTEPCKSFLILGITLFFSVVLHFGVQLGVRFLLKIVSSQKPKNAQK